MGAITAVAVWDHAPTAQQLLELRLAQGWTPTATALKDGDRILGYAECTVTSAPHRTSGSVRNENS